MKRRHFAFFWLSIAICLGAALTATNAWADTNVALGASVAVVATDSYSGTGYNNGTAGNVGNITNGTFLPDGTPYWGYCRGQLRPSNGAAMAMSSRSISAQPIRSIPSLCKPMTTTSTSCSTGTKAPTSGRLLWDRPIENNGYGFTH
jgi:hypothetical protein